MAVPGSSKWWRAGWRGEFSQLPAQRTRANQLDSRDLERAWRYHESADQLLNGRIQSFLIAQAFLIVGYAQILTASSFNERLDLKLVLLSISALAVVLTLVMKALAAQLSRGLRTLKKNYLLHEVDGDDVYKSYFGAVRGDADNTTPDGFARGWTRIMPICFLTFWLLAIAYATYAVFLHLFVAA